MDWQSRIEFKEDVLTGKPVIKGTRLAVEFVVDLLAQGWAEQEVLDNYPNLTFRLRTFVRVLLMPPKC